MVVIQQNRLLDFVLPFLKRISFHLFLKEYPNNMIAVRKMFSEGLLNNILSL
jgi:hypothetical protein